MAPQAGIPFTPPTPASVLTSLITMELGRTPVKVGCLTDLESCVLLTECNHGQPHDRENCGEFCVHRGIAPEKYYYYYNRPKELTNLVITSEGNIMTRGNLDS